MPTPLMASSLSLRPNLTIFSPSSYSSTTKSNTRNNNNNSIRCGPRDNRGALVKGRILSTEAIQAVQALKRAQIGNPSNLDELISKSLSRLIKKDLLASLNELLRQNHCNLALKVFLAVRSELWYDTNCSMYADLVSALARNRMWEEMEGLICDLEGEAEGLDSGDERGLLRLVRALIAAARPELVVRVYRLMKKSGWRSENRVADEYLVKVLSRGLRRLGEKGVADEVDRELLSFSGGNLERLSA